MLTSMWTHIPGLKVVCPATPYDAKGMLIQAIRDNDPVIFLEHKMLYSLQGEVPEELYTVPFGEANFVREGKDVTLVTYGRMVHIALEHRGEHLRVLGRRAQAGAVHGADHQRRGGLAAEHIAELGRLVEQLVEAAADKVDEHQFAHGAHATGSSANGHAHVKAPTAWRCSANAATPKAGWRRRSSNASTAKSRS